MFNVDKDTGDITMHRGDTGSFKVRCVRQSGEDWTSDDRMLWTVRNSGGEIVMQRFYRLDDQWDLGDGVVLIEFHNEDTDKLPSGIYNVERRYIIDPVWDGTAPTGRCVDALDQDAAIVDGSVVRLPATGTSTLTINDIIGEV